MKIRLLGTGTPTPSLRRMSSGYVIEIGDDVIVIDHGFGAHHRLLELGIAATRVTHLFFTHLHYGHCGDYARLVLTRWDQGASQVPDLNVYGPTPLKRMTELLFAPDGVYGPDLEARTRHDCSLGIYEARGGKLPRAWPKPNITEVKLGDVVEGNGWTLAVGAAEHFSPYLRTFAFRVTTSEGSLVYSGDSGPIPSMKEFAKGCDVLIHMCHYISGTALNEGFANSCMGHVELAQLARDAGVGSLVTTHITEQFDRPGIRERVISEMSALYSGTIYFGEDGMEIPLKGPSLDKLL
ncbi:MAG: MBL fold metallo-hydrolase [Bradyrhizobiaceae bacterium]|nr:MAG: MBL fold metallo-hydrolase [Bradyrhizobiaceae bacterium]